MAKEDEYEIEEDDVERWFSVIKKAPKENLLSLFSVSVTTQAINEFTTIAVYDDKGNEASKTEEEEISAVISKYMEQQEHESELCKNENALEEVYERYQHMDKVLSDTGLLDITENDFRMTILYELWIAVKEALNKKKVM